MKIMFFEVQKYDRLPVNKEFSIQNICPSLYPVFVLCLVGSPYFFSEYHPYLPAGDTTMTPLATIPSASMENFVKGKKCYHIIDKARQIVGK